MWKLLRVSVKCDVSGVLLLILIKKFVWHAEHEWVNFSISLVCIRVKLREIQRTELEIRCEICLRVI